MGSLSSTLRVKCEFTIYKGLSEHKCEKNKKSKYSYFYKDKNSTNKTDKLSVVEDPEDYKKHKIRIQATDCDCEKTIRLKIVNQLTKSDNFNPGVVYNYTEKIEINTDYGFVYHVFEKTREIRSQSEYVDGFVGSLMPGTTFYDSGYIKRVAADCSAEQLRRLSNVYDEEGHISKFIKLLQLSADLTFDCVIVNKIIKPIEKK